MLKNDTGQAAAEFYEQRRLWADYVSTLDASATAGFAWGSGYRGGWTEYCYYGKQIAKILGMSDDKVSRAILELEARI